MQPAAFKQTEAAFNVGCGFLAVQLLPEGVYTAMNGRLFDREGELERGFGLLRAD